MNHTPSDPSNKTADHEEKTAPEQTEKQHPGGLLLELLICVIAPTYVLKKFSGPESFGPDIALVLGLALPLGWGIYQFIKTKKFGLVPILGVVGLLLTGGIALLELDPAYIAIKEAAIPLIICIATLVSLYTPYPLVKTFLYNDRVMQVSKVDAALEARGNSQDFQNTLTKATYMLAGSFLLSSVLNYGLATYIVTSPAGTPEFNDQLGTLNVVSYAVISIPCMAIMVYAMFYLFRRIKSLTGLELDEIVIQ